MMLLAQRSGWGQLRRRDCGIGNLVVFIVIIESAYAAETAFATIAPRVGASFIFRYS